MSHPQRNMRYVKDTPLEMAHRVWQLRPPQPSLTVVVKGTFDPVQDGAAVLAPKQPPPACEAYYDDDVERSLRTGREQAAGAAHQPTSIRTSVPVAERRAASTVRVLHLVPERPAPC